MSRSTPEGKVKKKIRQVLDIYKPRVYYNMPVPGGWGAPMLDFVGCADGRFFMIEAKAPGATPTPRQEGLIDDLLLANAIVFVIDGDTIELEHWLRDIFLVTT